MNRHWHGPWGRPPSRWRALQRRWWPRLVLPVDLGTLGSLTAALLALVLGGSGLEPWAAVLAGLLMLGPASEAVLALVNRLRLHHLANPETQAQFALLADWPDADAEQLAGDAPLLAEAMQLAAPNALHPRPGAPARFILLLRPRRFSTSEQRWIGWERKRGKLEQLVDALATGSQAAFIDLPVQAGFVLRLPA